MSRANSPYYAAGVADGMADAEAVKAGADPVGMDGSKSWSGMYRDGYREGRAGEGSAPEFPGEAFDVDTSPITV
jgi:hypothetical protein